MPLTLDQKVDAASLLARLIERDPARLGGVPVFRPGFIMGETRIPKTLLLVDGVPGMAFSAEGQPVSVCASPSA